MTERLEFKAALAVDDAGTVTGTAWPFGTPDRVGDVIEKGAFGTPARLPMLFAHDQRDAIGVWESIAETDAGLTVKGRLLIDDVARAREVRALVREGAVAGLSIGFITQRATARARGGRTITALDLHEISIVPVPCHPGATITSMKAATDGPAPEKEDEMSTAENIETKEAPAFDQKALDALQARLDKLEAKGNRLPASNDNQANDNFDRKAFASFLRSGQIPAGEVERKALTVAGDAPGYVLAPEDTQREFVRNLIEFSPVRAIADVRSTVSHTIVLPKRLSVTNAKWKGEAVASEASEPTFGDMEIAVREITTHVDISNWMIEDGNDVEAEVRLALSEDIGQKEGAALVGITDPAAPTGFMTNSEVAAFANGHATAVSADALISFMYSLPATYRNRGTWTMNGTTLAAIRKLKDGAGNYLWQPAYAAGVPETILGRPVVELIDMPDVAANAFPIAFGDFKSGYRIYDRLQLVVLPNPWLLATDGKVRFHARHRVGADVVRPTAIRKLKMATAL